MKKYLIVNQLVPRSGTVEEFSSPHIFPQLNAIFTPMKYKIFNFFFTEVIVLQGEFGEED